MMKKKILKICAKKLRKFSRSCLCGFVQTGPTKIHRICPSLAADRQGILCECILVKFFPMARWPVREKKSLSS